MSHVPYHRIRRVTNTENVYTKLSGIKTETIQHLQERTTSNVLSCINLIRILLVCISVKRAQLLRRLNYPHKKGIQHSNILTKITFYLEGICIRSISVNST